MSAPLTITAANSVFTLTIPGLFSTPQKLQGFAADAAFETDDVENKELVLGVDGFLSAGWIPHLTRQTISVMPNNLTSVLFETWLATEDQQQQPYPANGVLIIPGIARQYTLNTGYLTRIKPVPDARKVMQMRGFVITWAQVDASNI